MFRMSVILSSVATRCTPPIKPAANFNAVSVVPAINNVQITCQFKYSVTSAKSVDCVVTELECVVPQTSMLHI